MTQEVWTFQTIMPSGKYKGTALGNVPTYYLIWLYDTYGVDKKSPLGIYLHDNIEAIRQEYKRNNKNNAR